MPIDRSHTGHVGVPCGASLLCHHTARATVVVPPILRPLSPFHAASIQYAVGRHGLSGPIDVHIAERGRSSCE